MDSFNKFFNINLGPKKRYMHPTLDTKRPHETVPVMHRTKFDVYKFKLLKDREKGRFNITDNEANTLMKRFNVKFSQNNVATLGNTGVRLYKNQNGGGYIIEK